MEVGVVEAAVGVAEGVAVEGQHNLASLQSHSKMNLWSSLLTLDGNHIHLWAVKKDSSRSHLN